MRFRKSKTLEEYESYLLPKDIEKIINDFSPLENQIKTLEGKAADSYISLLCGLVESSVKTRVRDLSRQRKTEMAEEFASADARDMAQSPRYYRPWRRLFRLTPNRAMALIIDHEMQVARIKHMQQQETNDDLRGQADDLEDKYYNEAAYEEPADEQNVEEDGGNAEEEAPAAALPKKGTRAKPKDEAPKPEQEPLDGQLPGQVTIDEAMEAPTDNEGGEQ